MCNAIAFRLHLRAGRRRGDPRPHRASGARTRRAGRRRSRGRCCSRSTATAASSRRAGEARCARPATATRRARGWCRSSRRRTSAAGACGRWRRSTRSSRSPREHGLRAHLDGARLMNAVVASGVAGGRLRAAASTPPGSTSPRASARRSARCSPARAELIDEAWRYKQMFGGAMRQAGIVAAGALYALDHNVERLAEDHEQRAAARRGPRGDCPASRSTRPRSRRTSSCSRSPMPSAVCGRLWRARRAARADRRAAPARGHASGRRRARRSSAGSGTISSGASGW